MTVTITASQLASGVPPFAQVVVNGMADGDQFIVTGSTGEYSWQVQGGVGTSDGEQLVLVDTRVPWGGPVTYRVTIGLDVVETSPLTIVDDETFVVFQSLDGTTIVPVEVVTFTDPQTFRTRRAFFAVQGRRSEVLRYDKTALPERPLEVETQGDATRALADLLASGAPIVRRQRIGLRDIAPVQVISVGDYSHVLVGAVGDLRVWSLPTKEMDLPEPGTVLFIFEWDEFDTIYETSTWDDDFDVEWAPSTWNAFDAEDWKARLP